jgi:protein-disulfide isomerase
MVLGACAQQPAPAADSAAAPSAQETTSAETPAESETTADESASESAVAEQTPAADEEAADAGSADDSAATSDAGDQVADETYNGMTVGFTAEGYPFRGDPDAPVTIYEYSDFQCPFCSRYAIQTQPALNDAYVSQGAAKVIFRDFPLESLHPNARAASVASLCVADQGAPIYWEMHDQIFNTQGEWSQSGDAEAYFADLAEGIGADMDQYNACVESGEKNEMIDAGIQEAQSKGFGGTPSFLFVDESSGESYDLVGAQPFEQFASFIDAIAAGEAPVTEQPEPENQIPYWATQEGLSPDPDNPGFTMAGDAFRGDPDAPVVVIEFADFQCPFCSKHVAETQPTLDEQFVDTGDVKWVFKHFPLPIHPAAPAAGAAAECAAEQGQFWEMHDLLFEDVDRWANGDTDAALKELAGELGLDQEAFDACMDSEEASAHVDSDQEAGAPFVQGTPTFIVLVGEQGRIIPGALPVDQFSDFLQQTVDNAKGQ